MLNKLLVGALVAGLSSTVSAAGITNGDFASGLSGWTAAGITAPSVTNGALLSTSQLGENTAFDASAFNGTYGSSLGQVVSLSAGTTLSFDWKFTTAETSSYAQTYNDAAFFVLNGTVIKLSDVVQATSTAGATTGHYSVMLTAPVSNLSFVVANVGDNGVSSSLFIDNVVASIPEPETYAMFLSGLAILGAIARRRSAS